jgi:hypothetical protein
MAEFKKLALKHFPPIQERETPEARYWRKYGGPVVRALAGCLPLSAS